MATSPLTRSASAVLARPAADSTRRRWARRHGARTVAVAGIVLLAACSDEPSPTDPSMIDPGTPSANRTPTGAEVERPHEAAFREISEQVKGFGGYFYDDEGNLVAYLQDGAEEDRARELLERILKERELGRRERSTGKIVFRKGEYSFTELADWRDRGTQPVLEVKGVEWADLDEAQNRFIVGVSTDAGRQEATKVLQSQDIPLKAVAFEESGRIVDLLTLRQYSRPIEGGFQIQRKGGGTCTLGFNLIRNGYRAFMTNSHCTATQLSTSFSVFHQNSNAIASHRAGVEIFDPSGWSCGFLWLNKCRWSDAAVVYKYGDVSANHGKIARTTSWAYGAGNSGSITVNPNNPRMTIIGEHSFPTGGEMMDKMGRTTGWTYGFVKKTCVDVNKQGGWRAICQDWIENMHSGGGDSGSPVFRWYGNTVRLAGILWGGTTQGGKQYTLYSAMWNIRADISGLSTF